MQTLLKLSIYSGGLWLMDLVFLAIIAVTLYTCYSKALEQRVKFYETGPFMLAVLTLVGWIISIFIRIWEL